MKPVRVFWKWLLVLLGGSVLVAGVLLGVGAHAKAGHLRALAAEAQAGAHRWLAQGRDPSAALALMAQVKPALDAGDADRAEALLNRALAMLQVDGPHGVSSPLPVNTDEEPVSDLYAAPEPVTIDGYAGDAMEPFLSPDGRYLFFNNSNAGDMDTNLEWAEREGKLRFRYRGELPGANSRALDAVPSLDRAGHFYFTSLREFDRTGRSIFVGQFDGTGVRDVRPVAGEISPERPGEVGAQVGFQINMDACISPDGRTLYLSRALIVAGAPAPKRSELLVARWKDGAFAIDPESGRLMRNINTGALQYAAAISADGRELYFTRASQLRAGADKPGARLRLMVAARGSESEVFGVPRVLRALTGFVEAPAVSLDGKEMFFHKKTGGVFGIYRAERTGR